MRVAVFLLLLLSTGCEEDSAVIDVGGLEPAPDLGPPMQALTHTFPELTVSAGGDEIHCVSWTLNNEEALYVSGLTLQSTGGFHHGNWFAVPSEVYMGDDGFWDCEEREFEEISAALSGTVLFAQSTQALLETQTFEDGTVVKIPPRSKVVADVHVLNPTPRELGTQAWLTLDLLHPALVTAVLSPVLLSYYDLHIPASSRTRHVGRCGRIEFGDSERGLDWPEMKLRYVLPHFHGFGVGWELTAGGDDPIGRAGDFDAQSLGRQVELEVPRSGLDFSCSYNNWSSRDLEWGLGDGEMCVLLGLAESDWIVVGGVRDGRTIVSVEDGVKVFEGECEWTRVQKGRAYSMPSSFELDRPLYVPPSVGDSPPVSPECRNADPGVAPLVAGTLGSVSAYVFLPSCTFAACHGSGAAGSLDLTADDLHAELLEHEMQRRTELPLVAPGDPEGSYLYRVLSTCPGMNEPSAMPANAPFLLDDPLIAIVRDWIASGALDDPR